MDDLAGVGDDAAGDDLVVEVELPGAPTPAPRTKTRAGAIVPAAVMSMGKNLGNAAAAIITASYPAAVACDDKTSIICATVVRGIMSTAIAVILRAASASTTAAFARG